MAMAAPPPGQVGERKSMVDYDVKMIVGSGAYGNVHLALDYDTGMEVAIKECNKAFMLSHNRTHHVMRERHTLARLNHPLIIKLHAAFQDEFCVYFVLDFMRNGDLRGLQMKLGLFNLPLTRYYSAQIVRALEYLQKVSVVHRDLKAENMLLDSNWNIKITDFGTSYAVTERKSTYTHRPKPVSRRNSFVGTLAYIAPEIIESEEVTYATDLWALACIIFEFHTGLYCFDPNPPEDCPMRIMTLDITDYPEGSNAEVQDLISLILVIRPQERLGMRGMDELKGHPFFYSMDWENLHLHVPPLPKSITNPGPVEHQPQPEPVPGMQAPSGFFDWNAIDSPPRTRRSTSGSLQARTRKGSMRAPECRCKTKRGRGCLCHLIPDYDFLSD